MGDGRLSLFFNHTTADSGGSRYYVVLLPTSLVSLDNGD